MKIYVSRCPETGRIFLCEEGVDNNLAEVFARDEKETALLTATFIVHAVNTYSELRFQGII